MTIDNAIAHARRANLVVDAWDDEDQESYVRVFTSAEKANRDLERWTAKREGHNLFAGVLKRRGM